MRVHFTDLGLKDYKEAWDIQQHVHDEITRAKISGSVSGTLPCLFFVEHPHVYTLGKSGHENNLLINPQFLASIGASFYKTDRGGDITYHGPGQIVGYPVFDLDQMGIGVKIYIFNLEEALIRTLGDFNIRATRLPGATGVWLDVDSPSGTRKISAIGVRVSRGVTMHGFALNVNTDLKYFSHINPCGFVDKGVTSMQQELHKTVEMQQVKEILLRHLADLFGITMASG
jgi:lipoyl(octanoyl) transferase